MTDEIKKKHRTHVNIGTIVFLTIVIYLTATVIKDLGRERLAVYEVGESVIDDEIRGQGVILRDESLETIPQEGYVNCYLKDGAKVKNGGVIYTIDTSGKITSYLNELAASKNEISQEEKTKVFYDLRDLSESFSDDNFAEVYSVKNTINYDLMAYSDTIISDNKKEINKKFGKNSYIEVRSPAAGIISYFSDGQEGLSEDKTDQSVFTSKTRMEDLRTREELAEGAPVYRLIRSQDWKLMVSVSKDEYDRLKDLKSRDINTLEVTFLKDNFTVRTAFDCEKKNDGYYAVLSFHDYVQRYMNQRFLSVRLLLSETKGLKIPSSSLVDKDIYRIPARFLTRGSDSDTDNQVNVLMVNKKGQKFLRQRTVTVYRREGENVCIGTEGLNKGDILSSVDKTDRFPLLETSKIQGVFMVNRGYAVFKPVNVIRRNEDYCIVAPDDSGLVLYDRIILNSNTIKENDVIY